MPVPTSQIKKHEAAIAQNKQALREAEESRLVSSWLKASLKSTSTTHQSKPSIDINQGQMQDDESDFSANEEGDSGLGFIAPKITGNDLVDRQHLSANDRLRRQMLGKNAFKPNMSASKPLPAQSRNVRTEDSEDETEGRTKVAGKKSNSTSKTPVPMTVTTTENAADAVDGDHINASTSGTTTATMKAPSKKRPASYLDEMLAKRSLKKNRSLQQPQSRKAKKSDREED